MLKNSNDADLISLKVHEDYIPFYQIWQEKVYEKTLDVYQYRILNSLSALKELDSVIEKTLSGIIQSNENIKDCIAETRSFILEDKVLEKYYKHIYECLRTSLDKNPQKPAESKRLLFKIRYAIKEIEPGYLKNVLTELKMCILNKDLGAIEKYTNIVVSQAISDGWSPKALFSLSRYFIKKDKEFEEIWEGFESKFTSDFSNEFDVIINCALLKDSQNVDCDSLFEKFKIKLKTYKEMIDEFKHIEELRHSLQSGKKYILHTVRAKDMYAAAYIAISQISEVFSLASFIDITYPWNLKFADIICINRVNGYYKQIAAKDLYKTENYIDISSRVFESILEIFNDKEKKAIRERLQGTFGYINISKVSLFQEEKYMNLWIALESFARTDMCDNIISNIKDYVPAAASLRYIYHIVRNFIEDCSRCNVSFDFSTCSIDMEQEKKQELVKQTIAVLRDNMLFSELQDKCKVNSLLYHRTNEVRKLVTDVDYAKMKIENHYNRVKWQIQRLYRIRNEIAHAALQEQRPLLVYIEHLYDYLITFIIEIATCISGKGFSSIEEALCHIKDTYDVFIAFSNDKDKAFVKNTVLSSGIIDFRI